MQVHKYIHLSAFIGTLEYRQQNLWAMNTTPFTSSYTSVMRVFVTWMALTDHTWSFTCSTHCMNHLTCKLYRTPRWWRKMSIWRRLTDRVYRISGSRGSGGLHHSDVVAFLLYWSFKLHYKHMTWIDQFTPETHACMNGWITTQLKNQQPVIVSVVCGRTDVRGPIICQEANPVGAW